MKPQAPPAARWWLWPFGLAVLAVVLLSLLRWLVQPERLGALALRHAEAASGLRLAVHGPARLGIWPRLHLQLQQLRVSDPQRPELSLATAEQVALYLPLSVLAGESRIDAIGLQAPRIELAAWAQRGRSQVGPPSPPWLPPIARLRIRDGSLIGDGWRLEGLDLELEGLLQPNQPLRLKSGGKLLGAGAPLPLAVQIVARNPATAQTLAWSLASLRLGDGGSDFLRADAGDFSLEDWNSPRLTLQGEFADWPAGWPALPAEVHGLLRGLRIDMRIDPRSDSVLSARAEGNGRRAQVALDPAGLAAWVGRGDWLSLPPGGARIELDALDLRGLRIEGLRIRHGDDAAD